MHRSYHQRCPVSLTLDLVGDRWTLPIIRDLLVGPRRFNELRAGLPGLSPTLLSARLESLVAAGIVVRDEGYALTARGQELWPVVAALGRWGVPELIRLDDPADHFSPHYVPLVLRVLVQPEWAPDEGTAFDLLLDGTPWRVTIAERRRGVRDVDRIVVGEVDDDAPVPVRLVTSLGVLVRLGQGRAPAGFEARGLLQVDGPPDAVTAVLRLLGVAEPNVTSEVAGARR